MNTTDLSTITFKEAFSQGIKLSKQQMFEIIIRSDLDAKDYYGKNILGLIAKGNHIYLNPEHIKAIIEKTNPQKHTYDNEYLVFLLRSNKELNYTPEHLMEIIDKTDLKKFERYSWSATSFILTHNKDKDCNLNFTPEQIITIVNKSDLNTNAFFSGTPLNTILYNNQNLGLSDQQILEIAKNSNLNKTSGEVNETPLFNAVTFMPHLALELVKMGANPNHKNIMGKSVLDMDEYKNYEFTEPETYKKQKLAVEAITDYLGTQQKKNTP